MEGGGGVCRDHAFWSNKFLPFVILTQSTEIRTCVLSRVTVLIIVVIKTASMAEYYVIKHRLAVQCLCDKKNVITSVPSFGSGFLPWIFPQTLLMSLFLVAPLATTPCQSCVYIVQVYHRSHLLPASGCLDHGC